MVSGTKEGGKAASMTNRAKYGEDFYKVIGRLGGKRKGPKGFAIMDRQKHIEASIKGGKKSRRT